MDTIPAGPALAAAKAAEARAHEAAHEAWSKYKSCCRMGGTAEERAWAYARAREAEQQLWTVRNDSAANA